MSGEGPAPDDLTPTNEVEPSLRSLEDGEMFPDELDRELSVRRQSIPVVDLTLGDDDEEDEYDDDLLPRRRANFGPVAIGLAVAASLLVAVGAGLYYQSLPGQKVARLRHTENAVWVAGDEPTLPGGRFAPGDVTLASGYVQLQLPSGVRLAFAGPCQFAWEGDNSLRLHQGRVRVLVPPPAKGFLIRAPNVTIRDQGTEFGVAVDKWNNVEVHVFQGAVTLNDQLTVRTGEARIVDNQQREDGQATVRETQLHPTAFPRI